MVCDLPTVDGTSDVVPGAADDSDPSVSSEDAAFEGVGHPRPLYCTFSHSSVRMYSLTPKKLSKMLRTSFRKRRFQTTPRKFGNLALAEYVRLHGRGLSVVGTGSCRSAYAFFPAGIFSVP